MPKPDPGFQTPAHNTTAQAPLYADKVPAGFPSPAQDYVERPLDLNELCVRKPAATFFLRAEGDSMIGVGIFNNSVLVCDRSVHPTHGKIVIAAVDGEFLVKRLDLSNPDAPVLRTENPDYPAIHLGSESELEIFGVVTYIISATQDL